MKDGNNGGRMEVENQAHVLMIFVKSMGVGKRKGMGKRQQTGFYNNTRLLLIMMTQSYAPGSLWKERSMQEALNPPHPTPKLLANDHEGRWVCSAKVLGWFSFLACNLPYFTLKAR